MFRLRGLRSLAVPAALAFALFYTQISHAQAQACFPSCDVTDSRMVVIAGPNLSTLTDQIVRFQLIVFEGQEDLQFGIFDGDSVGPWDLGLNLPLVYELFADPQGDGSGSGGLLQTLSGSTMVDNGWFDVTRPLDDAALTTSGAYSYVLRVTKSPNPTRATFNSGFKIRSMGGLIQLRPQIFSYIANLTDGVDGLIIFNNQFADPDNTTYDGTFTFYLHVPQILDETGGPPDRLDFWDGDFDHGASDGASLDTDDPNTSNDGVPEFALGSSAIPERAQGIGNPADDINVTFFNRAPSTYYELLPPGATAGSGFLNPNPSGNEEWEHFIVSVNNEDDPDILTGSALEKGIYQLQVSGVDMFNLQSLIFNFTVLCVLEDGSPCEPIECPLNSNLTFVDGECVPPEEECADCEGGVTSMTISHDREENDVHLKVLEWVNGGWSVTLNTEANSGAMVAAGDEVSFELSAGSTWAAVQIKDKVGHKQWFTKGYVKVDCSQNVGAGTRFGEYPDYIEFTVLDSESRAGWICPLEPPLQGCTPGYWKQSHHFDDWFTASPNDSFDLVFGVNAGGITMLQALSSGGGGLAALNRHAAAAYLNAGSPDVSYGQFPTPAAVIALVQDAYNGGDVEAAKNLLDTLNNAGCPLGNDGNDSGNGNINTNQNTGSQSGGGANSNSNSRSSSNSNSSSSQRRDSNRNSNGNRR